MTKQIHGYTPKKGETADAVPPLNHFSVVINQPLMAAIMASMLVNALVLVS